MMRINIRINLHTYIKLIVKPKSLVQRAIHFKEHFKEIGRCLCAYIKHILPNGETINEQVLEK